MKPFDKSITVGPRVTLLGGTPWTIPDIGTPIDRMCMAYRWYIQEDTTVHDKKVALKDFQLAGKDFVSKCPKLYEYLYSQMNMAAPDINRKLRASLEASYQIGGWSALSARWNNLYQLCQHWSAREALNTPEKKILKIELIYEMYKVCEELIELAGIASNELSKKSSN